MPGDTLNVKMLDVLKKAKRKYINKQQKIEI